MTVFEVAACHQSTNCRQQERGHAAAAQASLFTGACLRLFLQSGGPAYHQKLQIALHKRCYISLRYNRMYNFENLLEIFSFNLFYWKGKVQLVRGWKYINNTMRCEVCWCVGFAESFVRSKFSALLLFCCLCVFSGSSTGYIRCLSKRLSCCTHA